MNYNKNYRNKKGDILSRNKNFARPFTVHSYVSSYWGNVNNYAAPLSTENAPTVTCNDEPAKDSTQIDNLNSIATTPKIKTGLTLKTFLISIIVLTIIVILVLSVMLASKSSNINVCLTPTCIESASRVLQRLDKDIDPCVDFYSFACGNFLKKTTLPNDVMTSNSFSEISIELNNQLKNLIDMPVTNESPKVQRILQQIYMHCMTYENMSHKEILNIKLLFESLGSWPIIMGSKWNENDFDFKNLTLHLKRIGIPYSRPFSFTVSRDVLKSGTHRLLGNCDPPRPIQNNIANVILNSVMALGGSKDIINYDYNNNLKFSYDLHVCQAPKRGRATTFREVLIRTGYNWTSFVQELIGTTSITITDDEAIIVDINFERCFQYFFRTPKRLQANFVFIEIFTQMLSYLPGLLSEVAITPDSKQCVTTVSKSLPLMINFLYVKTYFDNRSRALIKEMVINIQKEFMGILRTLNWLDERTRQAAVEKLSVMKICIGYPDELLNNTKLEKFYSNLKLNLTTYLSTMMSINAFNADRNYKLLRELVKNCYWIDDSEQVTIVNAYYQLTTNGISIPAGILHKTVFDANRPTYLNYATIGVIVGHELTHGFDNDGKQYDKDGNLENWWSDETSTTFQQKCQCVVDQYEKYVVPGVNMRIDGLLTLAENIADNGGLKHSFLAYTNWIKRQGFEKSLPGLNYTSDQMFWIAFAQFWCSYSKLNYMKFLMTDVHAPSMFRVIGTLSNSEKFSEHFKCPVGSPMNPKNKCSIW